LKSRHGGTDRISTKMKLAEELKLLGEVLVRARERAGLKQSDVAARLELPASSSCRKLWSAAACRRFDAGSLLPAAAASRGS